MSPPFIYSRCPPLTHNISGFVEEGRRRKSNWINGAWQDSIYMGLLEEEWLDPAPVELREKVQPKERVPPAEQIRQKELERVQSTEQVHTNGSTEQNARQPS